jgi:hypothetical protein
VEGGLKMSRRGRIEGRKSSWDTIVGMEVGEESVSRKKEVENTV